MTKANKIVHVPSHSEFYDLEDVGLNLDLKTGLRTSSWGNLGYWCHPKSDAYSTSAKRLATVLGEFADLSENDIIFDVGFGCGDQLSVWRDDFRVAHIAGVNLSESQTRFALASIESQREADIHIQQGDACIATDWQQAHRETNKIIALDCVYHFSSKQSFLTLCQNQLAKLDKGIGVVVMSDFILTRSNLTLWQRVWLKVICRLSYMPFTNLLTRSEYESMLNELGLKITKTRDVSEEVMDGFAAWLPAFKDRYEQHRRSDSSVPKIQWAKYLGTAYFLKWLRKHAIMEYHLIEVVPVAK